MTKRRQKLRYTEFQNKRKRNKAILRMAGYQKGGMYWYKIDDIHLQVYHLHGKWREITPYEETTQLCEILNTDYLPNGHNSEIRETSSKTET